MAQTSNKARVVIYTRPGCHLCDEAKQVMLSSGCNDDYTLDEINIESDPTLLRRYQFDIPVITIDGTEAFRHRLTTTDFRQAILKR